MLNDILKHDLKQWRPPSMTILDLVTDFDIFDDFRENFVEHLQLMWYTFRKEKPADTWSVPIGACICTVLETGLSGNCYMYVFRT